MASSSYTLLPAEDSPLLIDDRDDDDEDVPLQSYSSYRPPSALTNNNKSKDRRRKTTASISSSSSSSSSPRRNKSVKFDDNNKNSNTNSSAKDQNHDDNDDGNNERAINEATNNNIQHDSDTVNMGITAVVIVKFDAKKGNVIEWSSPSNLADKLNGIEFKAMASGLHKISIDYIMFRHRIEGRNEYGIACFHNRTTTTGTERGSRMRSLVFLLKDYRAISPHYKFLRDEIEKLNESSLLDTSRVAAYYDQYKLMKPNNNNNNNNLSDFNDSYSDYTYDAPVKSLKDVHVDEVSAKVGSLLQLFNFFGENTLLIWKSLLLRKRILFYSPVPIGVVCARVHATGHMLMNSHSETRRLVIHPERLYFVNITDMPTLAKERFFVACTSEKIFEMKKDCYDVFINNQNINIKEEHKKQLRITDSDRKLYEQLQSSVLCHAGTDTSDEGHAALEEQIKRFFKDLNAAIFSTMKRYYGCTITSEEITKMRLDKGDYEFVEVLSNKYEFDVTIQRSKGCCFF